MQAKSSTKSFNRVLVGVLILALLPAAALGQWTIAGTATVEDMLGVGTQTPARGIHLVGSDAVFRMDRDRYSSAFMLVRTAAGDFDTIWKSFSIGVSASGVNDGVFTISDKDTTAGGTGPARFTIDNDGQVEIGSESEPQAGLHVRNPTTGHLLRLDSNNGNQVVTIQNDGDIYARGEDLELRLSYDSPNGVWLYENVTLLANTVQGDDQESFLALGARGGIICTPGLNSLLRIMDQDGYTTNYVFTDYSFELGEPNSDLTMAATKQGDGNELILSTTGEGIDFWGDSDDNTPQSLVYRWFNNTRNNSGKLMDLASDGDLRVRGTVTPSVAFDLAEAYWKSEEGIGAGDVVCIDPAQPNAVVLARAANDRAVVGVVSTDPGIVMGLGIFNAVQLADAWGEEIAALFLGEQKELQQRLAGTDPYLKNRLAARSRKASSRGKSGGPEEVARARQANEDEEKELEEALEEAALQAFIEDRFARLSMAGRVPVKVDASYGAIQIGDFLVASDTPGHAMRASRPAPEGAVIGKALEPYTAGRGTIMMMVLNR